MKKSIRRVFAFIIIMSAFLMCVPVANAKSAVLAHWKFQNKAGCYTGNVDTDVVAFLDITGNGNDLEVGIEGNGDKLDIFSWDEGVDLNTLKPSGEETSLKFNNSLTMARSVDPYDSTETVFSGAYVSGKYFRTVENAPINSFDGAGGWTIEIVFKISDEWNTNYNRYTGLFSRQGVVESQNEPPLSLALGELEENGLADGSLGKAGSVALQYIYINPAKYKVNVEMAGGTIRANTWFHYMVTSDGFYTKVYCNGKEVYKTVEGSEIFSVNPSFGWDVGVGRKSPDGETTKNEQHPEGSIRRLFCGSISEIRFSQGYMEMKDSLYPSGQAVATTTAVATTKKATTTTTGKTTVATTKEITTVTKATTTTTKDTVFELDETSSDISQTTDGDVLIGVPLWFNIALMVLCLLLAGGIIMGIILIKKNKI